MGLYFYYDPKGCRVVPVPATRDSVSVCPAQSAEYYTF
jgi:hypothetical protein